ncbi:MAG TPA: Gfo/Idh/MocA family oxidoreductase [Anaerolineaceae bacterium]|nr:Gfo/Idh/MocA family oxidoreductase [Anaerolineaceae bacterium]
MKFLICGLGSIGRRHLRNLMQLGEQDIILYRTGLSTLPDEELSAFGTFTNLDEALAQKPDGVIISNPSSLHIPVALAAASAGANLLIEKPISHNLEGIVELGEVLNQQGTRALAGFHFRQHPVLKEVKAELDSGTLGKPLSASVHWGEYLPGWHPYEDYRKTYAGRADLGGGVTLTLSHPIDYLRWLLGDVDAVSATLSKLSDLEIDVEDNAEITLQFANGAIGQLHLDYYQRPASHTLEIRCSEGTINWDNSTGTAKVYQASTDSCREFTLPEGYERNDLFLAEMRHFIEVIKGEMPVCTLEDGAAALQIALIAHDSSRNLSKLERLEMPWRLNGKIDNISDPEEQDDFKRP